MNKVMSIIAMVMLCGCTDLSHMDDGHEVDCTARLKSYTFGSGDYYQVHIDRIKTDHTGQQWVRPTSNLDIQISGWQHRELFTHFECKKD